MARKNIPASNVVTVCQFFLSQWKYRGVDAFRRGVEEWAQSVVRQFEDQPQEMARRFQAMAHGLLSEVFPDQPNVAMRGAYAIAQSVETQEGTEAKTQALVDALCRQLESRDNPSDLTSQVKDFLRNRSNSELRRITVETLADQFQLHRSQLSRRFQAETGQSVHDAITSEKLQRAFVLLQSGAKTVETRRELGFAKEDHFRKTFKERFGILPSHVEVDPDT